MATSTRKQRRSTALAVALLLSIGAPLAHARPLSEGPLEANEGIVLLSVTGNTARVHQFSQVWIRPIKDESTRGRRKNQILGNFAAGLARDTALFVGAVPAGEYALEQFYSEQGTIFFGDGAKELLGTVRVEAGTVADLGRLIVTPLNTSVITGRSAIVTSNLDLVRRFAPENAAHLDLEFVPGWTSPRTEADTVEEYAMDRPVGADAPVELPSGEIVVASRLGTLLVRTTDGAWHPVRTGKLESLLWVMPLAGGERGSEAPWLVAVGELDTLATITGTGTVTPLDTGDLPHGNLLFIDGNETAGLRSPELAVPLATYMGWQLYKPELGRADELVSLQGSFAPFPVDRTARLRANDPRTSILERYGNREGYLALQRGMGRREIYEGAGGAT